MTRQKQNYSKRELTNLTLSITWTTQVVMRKERKNDEGWMITLLRKNTRISNFNIQNNMHACTYFFSFAVRRISEMKWVWMNIEIIMETFESSGKMLFFLPLFHLVVRCGWYIRFSVSDSDDVWQPLDMYILLTNGHNEQYYQLSIDLPKKKNLAVVLLIF